MHQWLLSKQTSGGPSQYLHFSMKQFDANIRIWRMTVQKWMLLIQLTKQTNCRLICESRNLLHLRLRFPFKRLLAKLRLNMLSWQQLCFERRNSQLTCRPLGFDSLNVPWCHSLAIVILWHLNTLLHPSPWSMTSAAQDLVCVHKTCVEALESHKAEAATLRKRLQEHHKISQAIHLWANGGPRGPGASQNLLARRVLRVSRRWLYFQPFLIFANPKEHCKSEGADQRKQENKANLSICLYFDRSLQRQSLARFSDQILCKKSLLLYVFISFLETASQLAEEEDSRSHV